MKKKGLTTRAIHGFYKPNKEDGAIIPPVHFSTTFEYGNEGGFYDGSVTRKEWEEEKRFKFNNDFLHYDYSRTANPTRIIFEQTMATLDGNKFGLAYSSGSAVLANVVALLGPDESILFSADAYGGTYRFIVRVAGAQGIKNVMTDLTDSKMTEKALASNKVKVVWIETPSNPLLKVTDLYLLSKLCRKYGAYLVVDNTFATPVLQEPARLGADIVAYSTTKYINGHSDVVGGALTTSDPKLYSRLKFLQNSTGSIMSPFDAWLTLRGLKTLELRIERQVDNAEKIADFLNKHEKIKKVYFPGFFTGEQGKIVKKQMRRPGAIVSIELKDGLNMKKFLTGLTYFPLAESLGAVESLIDWPAHMTHSAIPEADRQKIGLSNNLLRLSIGIENCDDLLYDLESSLNKL